MSFWRLSDGTEPSLTCSRCGEPTPMTTHGVCPLCCDSDTHPTGGDAVAAPFMGSAGRDSGIAQTSGVNND